MSPANRPRLKRCLPHLREAIDSFDARVAPGDSLVIAAATSQGAIVMSVDDWPEVGSTELRDCDIALALVSAIECPDACKGDVILTGLAVMLGSAGLEAQAHDAAMIRQDGLQPLVVALLERQKTSVTLLITTIAMPPIECATRYRQTLCHR